MRRNPMRFDEVPVGCPFQAGPDVFMKIGPALNPHVQRIPVQPTNCLCLTGKRKGHHCTFGPEVPVRQITVEFRFR
jgi:hypothetical protein